MRMKIEINYREKAASEYLARLRAEHNRIQRNRFQIAAEVFCLFLLVIFGIILNILSHNK